MVGREASREVCVVEEVIALQDYKGVFVFAQQIDGKVSPVSYELIGRGKGLAADLKTEVTAVLLGHWGEFPPKGGSGIAGECDKLARYGADRVILVEDKALEVYTTEPYTHALTEVLAAYKPDIVLLGATAIGRDLAPRVAARLHTGLTADCTVLDIMEDGNLSMTRPAFGGNIMAQITCPDHRPQMATVRPGVMQRINPVEGAKAEIIKHEVKGLETFRNIEIVDVIKKVQKRMNIAEAKVLVAGGRGVGSAEGFAMLEELAEAFGGTIAASRACVDSGWVEKDRQVGQTGQTVRPNLYIACGISGAIQHLAGMEESDVIIAINSDSDAPIFSAADFGVVGDLRKVVPMLTEAVKGLMAAEV